MGETITNGQRTVREILATNGGPTCSFEFFPPKTDAGWEELFGHIARLQPLHPAYVSVTYGAGGSTRDRTHRLVTRIARETGLTVVAHLTCVGAGRREIADILAAYREAGIKNILALRGDPPREAAGDFRPPADGFAYAADLVAFIKAEFPEMCVGVAGFPEGHPETPNRLAELAHLQRKVAAGADYIVTQLFFDNRDFYDFCDRCRLVGITVPVIAGIMPIASHASMTRMAELAAGARFPAGLLRAVERAGDDDGVARVGIHWAAEQVRDLVDHGVSGIHFYTLNHSSATLEVCRALGITDFRRLAG